MKSLYTKDENMFFVRVYLFFLRNFLSRIFILLWHRTMMYLTVEYQLLWRIKDSKWQTAKNKSYKIILLNTLNNFNNFYIYTSCTARVNVSVAYFKNIKKKEMKTFNINYSEQRDFQFNPRYMPSYPITFINNDSQPFILAAE